MHTKYSQSQLSLFIPPPPLAPGSHASPFLDPALHLQHWSLVPPNQVNNQSLHVYGEITRMWPAPYLATTKINRWVLTNRRSLVITTKSREGGWWRGWLARSLITRMEHKACLPWHLAHIILSTPIQQSQTAHDDENYHLDLLFLQPYQPLVRIASGLGRAKTIADGHDGHWGRPLKAIVRLDGCFAMESAELVGRAVEL